VKIHELQVSEVPHDGNETLKPLYIHLHIPTSGGRSFDNTVENAGWKLQPPPGGYKVHDWTSEDAAFLIKACDDDTIDMISGHVSFKEIEPILQSGTCNRPTRIITVLREPVQHGESWLKHQCSDDAFSSFRHRKHNFNVLQNIENRMAYQLGDFSKLDRRSQKTSDVLERAKETLDSSFFVFFLDKYENDFDAFSKEVGLKDVKLPHVESHKNPRTLNASDEEEINKLNALDIELYKWARGRFARI